MPLARIAVYAKSRRADRQKADPRGRSSAVERQLPKLDVASSILVARSNVFNGLARNFAVIVGV
jgi:hypothetical protein